MSEIWKNLKDTTALSLFPVCSNPNRPALVCELLSNKSLTLRACDIVYFTIDLQTVIYYSTNHC